MFLIEYNGYDLTKYNEFLIECRLKDYSNQGTHRHHILPKFMGGKKNKANVIVLSVEDHYKAHIILAECFPSDTRWYRGNMFGALYCQRWLEGDYEEISTRLSKMQKGKVQIGRKHSVASKKKMSESKKGYKHSLESIEKMKTSQTGKKRTVERKLQISQNMKEQYASGKRDVNWGDPNSPGNLAYRKILSERNKTEKIGKNNPFAKQIEHVESGKVYECLKDAMLEFGFTNYNILYRRIENGVFRLLEERPPTHENLKYGKKAKEFLNVETGQIFKSRKEAIEQLPFSSYMFDKLCKEGKFEILEK